MSTTTELPRPVTRTRADRRSAWHSLAQQERAERHRRRLRSADLLVAASWISVAIAVGLYLLTGGLAEARSVADWTTAGGVIAGLAATDLLLVMLVLIARIPLLDRVFGHDRLLAAHRSIGKPALYLLLAHAVLLTVGYGMSDGSGPIRETVTLLFSGRDMLLAYLGLALLIAVVVTSLVAVRRKLRYEVWHLVHLLAYAGVVVAVPHELSSGVVFANGTLARVYWLALYVLALGAIAVYRFALPVVLSLRHGIRVQRVEWVAEDVYSIHLVGRDLDRLGADGGRFAIWRFWTARTWWHAHPISFSSAPTATGLRLTVRVLGDGTGRLSGLRAGTRVSFEGPYGVFTDESRSAPFLAVLAAGIGVTPVRALLEDSALAPGEATVVLRAGEPAEQYLWNEVADIVHASGGTVYAMTGHRPRGHATWMSADADRRGATLQRIFPRLADSDVYLCGPGPWTSLLVTDLRRAGVPATRIHLESFES